METARFHQVRVYSWAISDSNPWGSRMDAVEKRGVLADEYQAGSPG